MKRIALFFDGTWNKPQAAAPTNVVQLYRATLPMAQDGVVQLPKYIHGVGTGFRKAGFAKLLDGVLGGMFGKGTAANILEGYTFLAEQYVPGDEIYVFGFSRGAFAARSMVGLLRSAGLPPFSQSHRTIEALNFYKNRAAYTAPSKSYARRFRAKYSPQYVTGEGEAEWRQENGFPGDPHPLKVSYLGVWDTVGALGVPDHYKLLAFVVNQGFRFHDTKLSRMVKAGRHAVSLDEVRKTYPPTIWTLSDELTEADRAAVLQHWFPGDHGSVGGGHPWRGLSSHALGWVAEGAADCGLAFDQDQLARIAEAEDCLAPLTDEDPDLVTKLFRLNRLNRPKVYRDAITGETLSEAARCRHEGEPSYRPNLFD